MTEELDNNKIYEKSEISFRFEFKSPIRRRDMASKFSNNIGKKVKWFKGVDESYSPTSKVYKLSNKYSENSKTFIFETGFIPYREATQVMLRAMNIIDYFGYTDDRCEMSANIKLNERDVSKLNKLKFIMKLNNDNVLNEWNTSNSERQKVNYNILIDIKNPFITILSSKLVERLDPQFFNVDKSEFYGTDFSNIGKGYITTSYIGGKHYQNKKKEALETINRVIIAFNESVCNRTTYSEREKADIDNLLEYYRNTVSNTKNYKVFRESYPDIKLFVDLMEFDHLLEAHYNNFRDKIFELVSKGGITEGYINYDNIRKKIQIKDSVISNKMQISDVEFYNCVVEADVSRCLFNDCVIKHSSLNNCDIITNNYIKNSKVIECEYHGSSNEISNSYVNSSNTGLINADLVDCIVKEGRFTSNSTIDSNTIMLNKISED